MKSTRKVHRVVAGIASLMVGAAALAGCTASSTPDSASASGAEKEVVGETVDIGSGGESVVVGLTYVPNVQFAPVYVAASDEIFRASGIGASIRHHGADEGLFSALIAGDEDVTVATGDEVLQARAAGLDLVSIGSYYNKYPVVVVSQKDSGIASIDDLRGKKVGLPGEYGSNWFGLLAALDNAGMTLDDIEVVSIGFTQAASLASNQVDAIVGFSNSEVVQLEQLEVPINVIPLAGNEEVPLVSASIVTTREWADANPKLAAAVVGAITSGTDRVIQNPQHALEITENWDPGLTNPEARANATAMLNATIKLWEGVDGKASAYQNLELWEKMGPFLAKALDIDLQQMGVPDAATNEFVAK